MSSSFTELGVTTCNSSVEKLKNKDHCPDQMWQNMLKACVRAEKWQISDKLGANEDDIDIIDGPPECQIIMTDPDVNKPKEVATPDECLEADFGTVGNFKWRLFTYDNRDPKGELILDKPILCFYEEAPCPDTDDFKRKKLNEFEHLSGFADYIYWSEETRVAKIVEGIVEVCRKALDPSS